MTGSKKIGSDALPDCKEKRPGPHGGVKIESWIRKLQKGGRASEYILFRRRRFPGRTRCRGSLTVEAALVLPLFWYFLAGFLYLLLFFRLQEDIGQALADAGRELGQYAYDSEIGEEAALGLGLWKVKGEIKARCKDKAACRLVEGGSFGIYVGRSRLLDDNSMIELVADYHLRLPWILLGGKSIPVVQKQVCRAWTGYEGEAYGTQSDKAVYITPHGTVYHESSDCRYLDLSIRMEDAGSMKDARNKDGERYRACEQCCKDMVNGMVYITDYGNRYHRDLDCTGLKRTIYLVPITEVSGRGACKGCAS